MQSAQPSRTLAPNAAGDELAARQIGMAVLVEIAMVPVVAQPAFDRGFGQLFEQGEVPTRSLVATCYSDGRCRGATPSVCD